MIIDAHNHPEYWHKDLTKFLANMAEYGIDRTWLISWECGSDEYAPENLEVMTQLSTTEPIAFTRCVAWMERAPEKFVLGYAPDPRRPEAIDLLDAAIETYGVRVYGELQCRMCYDNPDALRMFRFCGEKGLPVIVHIDYEFATGSKYPRPNWWYGGGLSVFERAVKACPETTFLGHGPGFWAHISGDGLHDKVQYPDTPVLPGGTLQPLLRECPNLYCDLSAGSGLGGLSRDPVHALEFIDEFQDRILYGRDCLHNQHQEFLNGLDLSPGVREKIYSGNALKLVPL